MNTGSRKKLIIKDLQDKEYREAYVEASINVGIPCQIRILREQRGWNQKELGERACKMVQETISRIENPNYASINIKTLKRLAAAFDVALMIKFVPYSELVDRKLNLSLESLKVPSFNDESYFKEGQETTKAKTKASTAVSKEHKENTATGSSNVIHLPLKTNGNVDNTYCISQTATQTL